VTICNKLLFEILHEETNQSSQMWSQEYNILQIILKTTNISGNII
jgi:hypothetical protein